MMTMAMAGLKPLPTPTSAEGVKEGKGGSAQIASEGRVWVWCGRHGGWWDAAAAKWAVEAFETSTLP